MEHAQSTAMLQPPAAVRSVPSRRLWPALVALLLAMIAVFFALWNTHRSLQAIEDMVERRSLARDVRIRVEHLFSLLKDAESAGRGYQLTGRSEMLAPYREVLAELPDLRRMLGTSLAAQTGAAEQWHMLQELIDQRLVLVERLISNRRPAPTDEGSSQALTEGARKMVELRAAFAQLEAMEDQRLDALDDQMRALQADASRLAWRGAAAAVLLVVMAALIVAREHRLRRGLERDLREANCALEGRVEERTLALREARDRLAEFASAQNRAVEDEKRRLSREVHDQIGQVLTAIRLIANSIPRDSYPPGQAEAMAQALEVGIATTRKVAAALRPPLLDDLGLAAALRHMVEQLAAPTGLKALIEIEEAERLDPDGALTLYRIVQEAVTNVVRHAGARTVRIRGGALADSYATEIIDDGHGFVTGSVRAGAIGLTSMRERAVLAGGSMTVLPTPAGVTVRVALPTRNVP